LRLVIVGLLLAGCSQTTEPSGPPFLALSVGSNHACGIASSGTTLCWGWNGSEQLGAATGEMCATLYPCSTLPVPVSGGRLFVTIAAGGTHTCALDAGGIAYCWGSNRLGQLGDGSLTDTATMAPRAVVGGLRFVALSAGIDHTCALTSNGTAYCWGTNFSGQLGTGDTATAVPAPVSVGGSLHFSSLTASSNFTCGIATGSLYCWGDNTEGQLGSGDTVQRRTPSLVTPDFGARTLAAGPNSLHMCAVNASQAPYCWGDNVAWQLGNGMVTNRYNPTPVTTSETFQGIATGGAFTCALAVTAAAYCWGAKGQGDLGQLGQGSAAESSTPVPVAGGLSFRALMSGDAFSCGLTMAGRVYCWGSGFRGALGNGSTVTAFTPTEVRLPPQP